MKDEQLWNLVVRKPLRWFLRRFLTPDKAEATLATVEALVITVQGKE